MTVAGQPAVNYGYDANSRLTNLQSDLLNFGFSYDGLGRRTALTIPNGITTNYSYDNGSNLMEMKHLNPLNAILEKISYSYDANGNRTSMDRLNVAPKLPNPVSNISYNQANQMLTFNDKNITYDVNGNMETITSSCGTAMYTWNARNQLAGIAGFNADCSPLNAVFTYDAVGKRIQKTINEKTIQYLYDGMDIVQEIEDNTVTANYIRTLNIDEPLALINRDGIYYYIYDGLGSIIGLADQSGNEAVQYQYDPFGNTFSNNPSFKNPFQYTGRENDETGLYYYRARYYSPELQRFISEDPIGLAWGINLYAYVGNNPVNFVDPLGLFEFAYNAGAHLWLPGLPGATGVNVSSTWTNPYDKGPEFQGAAKEYVVGSLADIGVNAGISGLSGCKDGNKTEITIGAGKYLGFQLAFKNGKFDGITAGFGIGLSLPIQVTRPLSDLKKSLGGM